MGLARLCGFVGSVRSTNAQLFVQDSLSQKTAADDGTCIGLVFLLKKLPLQKLDMGKRQYHTGL